MSFIASFPSHLTGKIQTKGEPGNKAMSFVGACYSVHMYYYWCPLSINRLVLVILQMQLTCQRFDPVCTCMCPSYPIHATCSRVLYMYVLFYMHATYYIHGLQLHVHVRSLVCVYRGLKS